MSKLRFNISVSLDGFIAGPDHSVDHPLGIGGEALHSWAVKQRFFNEIHGAEGGETGPDDDVLREGFANIGATIMGRNMFGGGSGPWGEDPWNGWWGEDPPFHHPVFVLTHHARPPLVMQGGTTFTFVTDGIESALAKAMEAAQGTDISVAGGARAAQQYLSAGLVDEMELHVAPVLLGCGERLFDNIDTSRTALEPIRVLNTPDVVHLKYRLSKK